MPVSTKKRPRCKNGTRRNKETGKCEPKTLKGSNTNKNKASPKKANKNANANANKNKVSPKANKNANANKNKVSPKANNKPPAKLPAVGGLVFLPYSLSKNYRNRTGVSGFESLLEHWDKYSTTGVSKIMKKRQKIVDGKFVTDKLGLYIYNSGQFIIKDPEQVRPLTKEEKKRLYRPSKHSRLAQTNLDSFESEMLRMA